MIEIELEGFDSGKLADKSRFEDDYFDDKIWLVVSGYERSPINTISLYIHG